MNKVYKGKNKNMKKIPALFVCQVILGLLPFLLLIAFLVFKLYENYMILGYVFIALMVVSALLNFLATRRYNILLSGVRGERSLLKTVKKLKGNYTAFTNIPVRYKRGCSEIDLLLVGEKGIITVEVKNHSGMISGDSCDNTWTQHKVYRDGKMTEATMDNPIKQMRRQREILKSIFRANGLTDVWIDSVLYFSCDHVRLRLNLKPCDIVFSTEKELVKYVESYESKRTLTKEETEKIIKILKEQ